MGYTGGNATAQGKPEYEALVGRQEAEIRMLEVMRRCVTSKLKCDREYAASLSAVCALGFKCGGGSGAGGGAVDAAPGSSLMAGAWKRLLDELDAASRAIRSVCDRIEKNTLDRIAGICAEKRKAKKAYQDEYNRISLQYNNLVDELARKKADYTKHLETYRSMRSRFEEHFFKSGRGGRKLDDVREKYQRACRRLHLVHNEYVLLIAEAQESEKDFQTIMMPAFMQHHKQELENIIADWKNALTELAVQWNPASEEFVQIGLRMESCTDIIQPCEEYNDYTKKTERNDVEISFDDALVQGDTSGHLQANQLAVDNLTMDWVRNKMTELETRLKECQDAIETSVDNKSENNSEIQLIELKSEEHRLQKQVDVIKKALFEIGCEELPSGCDLPSLDINDIDITVDGTLKRPSLSSVSQASSMMTIATTLATSSLVDILRKPFRRKSVPNSGNGNLSMDSNSVQNNNSAITTTTASSGIGSSVKSLIEEEWFHGVLPREEVVRLLTKEGDFLVRETTRNDENQTVLSVCWGGHKHFIVQTTSEGEFRFEGPSFPTIQELITYQYQSALPVTSRSGAILRQPIPRERWELNNDDVLLLEKIGRGNFGDVYKARLRSTNKEAAVKTCRVTVPDEHKKKFLQEGRILKQYDHPNVVKLIGICVQKQPIMIVMELVAGGSLLSYLRNNSKTLSVLQLVSMCRDAAAGMMYLESKNCIHRDLAARNCLVDDKNIVKISDFGMSREEEEYIVSDGMKQIPIKWTAPEALNFGKYTTLCDVWSYGVLCWEIFAKGGTPYSGLSNSKAREKIDTGYRMPAPEGTPDEIYRLMLQCWQYQPENRPHFDRIYATVESLVKSLSPVPPKMRIVDGAKSNDIANVALFMLRI
ncbi:tyrosine-protein kinase Fer isoform X3 [Acyrthosiphon pisum]|uniref:Tyrosine-protein kinase n=1 Tax=Acyrthosiphon pisum TaxID=7029 RepID=A0A8R2AE60_ACYPI|nr:tyrosine-protein kinase Fer isoform X3 [Acyrthosiphon pisum]|eukprot:XP_003244865.1 PREDICTED: tyrosine-protein kinase Fps85D isoform X3 [Acyrthosiphon pisum]